MTLSPRPAAIVFDLDGTLIDSRADIATAVNRLRGELGLPPLSLETVVTMVGEGARKLIERALGANGTSAPPQGIDRPLARYLEIYDQVCLDSTRPYPGVPEMLAALAPLYPLALLSNKGEALSRRILHGLGLAGYLREILGGDSLPVRKPDPAGLRLLAERLEVPLADLLLVGDTWIDGATARAAGCRFALVEWGFPRPSKMGERTGERSGDLTADLRVAQAEELVRELI